MEFTEILTRIREHSHSEYEKGHWFEQLIRRFLRTDPVYKPLFSEVWLWNEFPYRKEFGGGDTGIDLVARTPEGAYWAIQCKCYAAETTINKADTDTFINTSGQRFRNEAGDKCEFAHRLWISTTDKWSDKARNSLKRQDPPVSLIDSAYLEASPVDWQKLHDKLWGPEARLPKKVLREHQQEALEAVCRGFRDRDRGRLIMACGTGKTFTSLKIAEQITAGKEAPGPVLFLVPSIALLGQTLAEWAAEAADDRPIKPLCVCSDAEVSKKKIRNGADDDDGFRAEDLALPATTDRDEIVRRLRDLRTNARKGPTVIFSTYQSLDAVVDALDCYRGEVGDEAVCELIVCDEAHRTTGVNSEANDASVFVKVHDNDYIAARRRLYMTATPRLYDENSKAKAEEREILLCSMDDEKIYGPEFYRIGFGEAVEKNLLADYKVLVLTVGNDKIPEAVQQAIAENGVEIPTEDTAKLIGCMNALSKQILGDGGSLAKADPGPMRRAVAFCADIKTSKRITERFNCLSKAYEEIRKADPEAAATVSVVAEHVDGGMSAGMRQEALARLKAGGENREGGGEVCRMLTNVRCLSEGVDVPSLDAALFLSSRKSQVDVVQSVGRVMRKAEGKKFGYIIIPIVVPCGVSPEEALKDSKQYGVVWSVLRALRAHDDRFSATVNKIELNNKKPDNILIARSARGGESAEEETAAAERAVQTTFNFEDLQSTIFARLVDKVGSRDYLSRWAGDVARIAERHIEYIRRSIADDEPYRKAFQGYLAGLQSCINPSVTEGEAVEMLAQHMITRPVFEALFGNYAFTELNPVSQEMQRVLDFPDRNIAQEDRERLEKFYKSVRERVEKIDNAEGRQQVIIELYDKFFKTAFPKMVEKLGIVYTPVEVVDFILHSVAAVLRSRFGRSPADENVHILDPFTGTGTFITRLLQSDLIPPEALARKYGKEIHANEIVLLAYYIAAVNIENAYHDRLPEGPQAAYVPFDGICLTDTFQLDGRNAADLFPEFFRENSARVQAQMKAPLRVIIGNPPYSIGQNSANDNAGNQSYPALEKRIAETYAAESKASNRQALYDAYFKAFRWSTDRLSDNDAGGGIIAFVTNGAWLDSAAAAGFRKSLAKEFSAVYVFNLRGNQRTSGETSRREGGKIFGSGSRTPVAVTLLVKTPAEEGPRKAPAEIYYYDIGDYKNREEKLKLIAEFKSVDNLPFESITPDAHGDWFNLRNDAFARFLPLAPEKKFDDAAEAAFTTYTCGLQSNRDSWVYNFSLPELQKNIRRTIDHYNEQKDLMAKAPAGEPQRDSAKGSWTRDWLKYAAKGIVLAEVPSEYRIGCYRPFTKQNCYFEDRLNEERFQLAKLFPYPGAENRVICLSGVSSSKDFSVLMVDVIPDYQTMFNAQFFPLYHYQEREATLFGDEGEAGGEGTPAGRYCRREAVSDYILLTCRKAYGPEVSKEDIFYYIYGFLHSPAYRTEFAADLKKMLPRIPRGGSPEDFRRFAEAGRRLADLHLGYEAPDPQLPAGITLSEKGSDYRVEKMRFAAKGDKSTIVYNNSITIAGIPPEAYKYVVNGKSAIEWVMERYARSRHKDSGIVNNPDHWAAEHGRPRYILDLLVSVIALSIESAEIIESLPLPPPH